MMLCWQVLLGNKDQLSMTWPYEDIREIHKRWFQLRDIGIEIFLTNGKTCLLACQNNRVGNSVGESYFEISKEKIYIMTGK